MIRNQGHALRGARLLAVLALLAIGSGCGPDPGSDPGQASEALARGRELHGRGPAHRGEALVWLTRACADPTVCREAMPYLADCFTTSRKMEAAALFFADLARRHPELEAEARGYRGFFLERANYLELAAQELAASLELRPTAMAYRRLAKVQARMGERSAAIASLERGLAMAPADAQIGFLLARYLQEEGRLDDARARLAEFLEVDPRNGHAWVTLGRVRTATGDDPGALQAFRRAIEMDPGNLEARLMIAKRALRGENLAEADAVLAEVLVIEAAFGGVHGQDPAP